MDHRDAERNRRQQKSVVDQGSKSSVRSAKVSTPMRLSALFAAMNDVGGEDTNDGEICCFICGRSGKFVQFSDFGKSGGPPGGNCELRL